ncbi:MAG: hypothetical protein HYV63_03360 [Candidatus Schekmanbacteria bacterium]|nr:hypothetical protein [Candidatus Schekmanbacteria bacterium]
MRHVSRQNLTGPLSSYLDRMQKRIDDGGEIQKTWDGQRRTRSMRAVEETLRRMAGARERCMYCEDSRGTDIEHFWPMRGEPGYPERAFRWPNLLWACSGCNRKKGTRFPLNAAGDPLLIDPTHDDPWQHLCFDSDTNELAARWDRTTGVESERGRQTLEILETLRFEAVADGRAKTKRNLIRAVRAYLDAASSRGIADARSELIEAIRDNDSYGLATWYFLWEGRDDCPFVDLRKSSPDTWEEIVVELSG